MSFNSKLSNFIKTSAKKNHFDDCGICSVKIDDLFFDKYKDWLQNKFNAAMYFLNNQFDLRKNPDLLIENVKSVVVVLKNYYLNNYFDDKEVE